MNSGVKSTISQIAPRLRQQWSLTADFVSVFRFSNFAFLLSNF